MSLYFMPQAAAYFARLDVPSADAVVAGLNKALAACKAKQTAPVELVRQVVTPEGELWLGAFAEAQDLTLVSLGEQHPPESFPERVRALLRAKRRLTLGGVNLEIGAAEIRDTIRTLLEEQRAYYGVMQEPVCIAQPEPLAFAAQETPLEEQLARSAHRWRSTLARRDFKIVMEEAAVAPQVIERDGREVVIIDRELLRRFERPLSGAALAARFARNHLPSLSFDASAETATEPDPSFDLRTPA